MTAETGIRFAALVPHPPIAVPEIGGEASKHAQKTQEGLREVARRVKEVAPEALVMITPHGRVDREAVGMLYSRMLEGDFSAFGKKDLSFKWPVHLGLCNALLAKAKDAGKKMVQWRGWDAEMDHGILVPLYFLRQAGVTAPLAALRMTLSPRSDLFAFGEMIGEAAREIGIKAAVLASGDLSHRLTADAPAGYDPKGKEFDALLTEALSANDVSAIMNLDSALIERAGECGLRPIVMMLGAIAGIHMKPRLVSYEGPFGVGYGVVSFETAPRSEEPGEILVRLAREALETYVREKKVLKPEGDLPQELAVKAGAFVTLKKKGDLRGCIGTISPIRRTLAEEVVRNAIESGTNDPRFLPVTLDELSQIEFSVDVLSPLETVSDMSELDPKVYGVVVEKGAKHGLLLPDLEGVTSVDQQIQIAKRKAGIKGEEDGVRLYKFKVTRYAERPKGWAP